MFHINIPPSPYDDAPTIVFHPRPPFHLIMVSCSVYFDPYPVMFDIQCKKGGSFPPHGFPKSNKICGISEQSDKGRACLSSDDPFLRPINLARRVSRQFSSFALKHPLTVPLRNFRDDSSSQRKRA